MSERQTARDNEDDRNRDGRGESREQRLDRNYAELLQELRVAQTGVQILFAFLLGIAFQQRFTTLTEPQHVLYLITFVSAALAAALLIAPVAAHRVLFRRHQKDEVVDVTARLAIGGLVALSVAILSAVLLVIDFVSNTLFAIITTGVLAAVLATTWFVLPIVLRRRPEDDI